MSVELQTTTCLSVFFKWSWWEREWDWDWLACDVWVVESTSKRGHFHFMCLPHLFCKKNIFQNISVSVSLICVHWKLNNYMVPFNSWKKRLENEKSIDLSCLVNLGIVNRCLTHGKVREKIKSSSQLEFCFSSWKSLEKWANIKYTLFMTILSTITI